MSEPGLLEHVNVMPTDSAQTGSAAPIFLLGIAARSGTNYLHDLIRMHPACDAASTYLEEDNLLANAHLLTRYVDGVARWWKHHWGTEELESEKEVLVQQLGLALQGFLNSQLERRKQTEGVNGANGQPLRLVTKTPTVKNLPLFFRLFPNRQLVVLVRDGRSVVESAAKTFDRPYGQVAKEWVSSARIIQECRQKYPEDAFLVVRYEDLYRNVEQELRRIFAYLNLDPEAYDYTAAANLPVRGSSTLRGEPTSHHSRWVAPGIHWNPVEKPADFNPLERWAVWNRAKHERFNWVAGEYLEQFGYSKKTFPRGRAFWTARNLVLDLLHVDGALWLARRLRREGREISSVKDLMNFLRLVKCTIVERVREFMLEM